MLHDRFLVRRAHAAVPRERRHEHQKCRTRQVEVGEQRVDDAELEARRDEEVRLALTGRDAPGAARRTGSVPAGEGETDLFVTPGFEFRVVDALLTNFHLPRSTLLVLVAAFAGYGRVRSAYQEAIVQHYRFFSFGDAMFVERA